MLNTKFDLYKSEWLDLVFDDRNKAYGAYDLRHHYAGTLNKAMGITFAIMLAASTAIYIVSHNKPIVDEQKTVVVVVPTLPEPPVAAQKKIELPKKVEPVKAQPVASTQKFISFKVTEKPTTEEPPKIVELTSEIGPTTKKGEDGPSLNIPEGPETSGGGTAEPAPSNEPMSTFGLEVQPEPFGGMAAFSKFLGKNLRFPGVAQDAGIQGRVILGFIIERDGSLSNITVERKAGYGFDEEAVRVLKLAKAWKPGIQNGRPVRVKYNIPINFTISE
jgi:protein TonB